MTISRRGLIVGAGVALAGLGAAGQATAWAAPSADPGEQDGTPTTLGVLRTVLGSARVERLDEPMTHLGLAWSGGAPRLWLLTATGWQDQDLPVGCGGGRDGRPARDAVTLAVSGAVGYKIIEAGEVRVCEIDVTSGPLRPLDPAARVLTTLWDRPLPRRYRNRASWGADESLRFAPDGTNRFPDAFFPVQTVTVHHTAMEVGDTGPAAQVRAIYHDHTITREFGDIGYHLLIDGDGTVYEGRSSGTDPIPVFGGGLGRPPRMNNAAHVAGFNAGNVGVALLGDFTSAPPTQAAQDALVQNIRCRGPRREPVSGDGTHRPRLEPQHDRRPEAVVHRRRVAGRGGRGDDARRRPGDRRGRLPRRRRGSEGRAACGVRGRRAICRCRVTWAYMVRC